MGYMVELAGMTIGPSSIIKSTPAACTNVDMDYKL